MQDKDRDLVDADLESDEGVDEDDDDVAVGLEDDDEEDEGDALADDEEDGDSASLDQILAQRAASRPGDDADDDSDILAITGEADDEPVVEPLPSRIAPIEEGEEFVCNSCFLVKPRVQLADAQRGYCRDCV